VANFSGDGKEAAFGSII